MRFRGASWHLLLKLFIFCVVFVIFLIFYNEYWTIDTILTMRSSRISYPKPNSKQQKFYVHTSKWRIPYVDPFNEYFALKNLSHLCSNLSLNYIHNTEIRTGLEINWDDELPVLETAVYRTKFKVKQNSADFQATVVFNNITEAVQVNVESISRTNSYAEDSTCINDKIAKLYCICFSDFKS